jgi:hypothetical protein
MGVAAAVLVAGLAGCGGATRTVTVATTPTAPPPAPGTAAAAAAGGGREDGIAVHGERASARYRPATGCGIERWAVKTLTDPGASRVNHRPKASSIAALTALPAPIDPTDRIAPTETTVWRITVTMTAFKEEDDSDIHLTVKDSRGRTMIVEFPLTPTCDATASQPDRAAMSQARAAFVAGCGQPRTSYRSVSGQATITGVGFFDRMHGQRGVAPNGIELHPVLAFSGTCD